MALSFPSGFSASTKTPTIALAVNLGASSRGNGRTPNRLTLLGNKTASGSAAVETPVQVPSLDDARSLFGAGSELFLMARAVFAQNRRANLWACPVAEGGGAVAATGVFVFATNASGAGVSRVWVAGNLSEVAVAVGDTPTVVAAAHAAKLNAITDLLVSASASTGTLTVAAKQKGPRGNNITLRAQLTSTGMTCAINGGSASVSPAAAKMGAGTATAGSVADDATNALAACATQKWSRFAVAFDDAANLTRVRTHVNTYSAIGERKRCQFDAATVASLGTAKTLATGQNAARGRLNWHFNADDTTGEIAAACAAAKLYGDGTVGGGVGRVKGEEAKASANLNGCMLASIRVQVAVDDQPLGTEIEDALNNGLVPLEPAAANPGFCRINKSITMRSLDGSNNPSYSVHDTSKVTVSDFVADTLEADIAAEFPNKNLAPEPADATGPQDSDTIFPSMVRGFIAKRLYDFQRAGLLVNVAENEPQLVVEQSAENPSFLLVEIPESVISHFHGMVGSVLQIA